MNDAQPSRGRAGAADALAPPAGDLGPAKEAAIGRGAYMALAAALLGWMFDGAEMGVFSLVGRPAVKELLAADLAGMAGADAEARVGLWFAVITAGFLVGAATGGVLFGWLGDRIGRVRAMMLSVLTYALFTGLCGFAASAWQVGALRFVAALGMGGEWSLGVALVMEVWPNRSRAFMAGLIGAAANVGYLVVGFVGLGLAMSVTSNTSGTWLGDKSWRLIMILGTAPALLTFFIRVFVPESAKWERERDSGAANHWATQDLLAVLVGALGPGLIIYLWAWEGPALFRHTTPVRVIGTLLGLAIAAVGYTYPVIRFFQRQAAEARAKNGAGAATDWTPTLRRMLLAACLSGVALLGTWGSTQWAPTWSDQLVESAHKKQPATASAASQPVAASQPLAASQPAAAAPKRYAKEWTLIWISVGAVVGTILAALAGDWLGRRLAYALLCALALASVYLFYLTNTEFGYGFLWWAFVAGACTASFYGWLPLYLPELFRTPVRATGQGFGFNFGRVLAAIGVLQTGNLMGMFKQDWNLGAALGLGDFVIPQGYPLACSAMSLVYILGLTIIWFAPETRGQPLPE